MKTDHAINVSSAAPDPQYRVFGIPAPGMTMSPGQKNWIDRFITAHNAFIVVAGLIFTSTFAAVNSINSVDDMATRPVMWFRATCTLEFCLSAFAIVCSAIIISSLSTYDPSREEHIRIPVIMAISGWSQCGTGMLMLSVVITLVAVGIKPVADLYENYNPPSVKASPKASVDDSSNCAQSMPVFGGIGPAYMVTISVGLTILIMATTAVLTVRAFFGMRSGTTSV